MSDSFEEVLQKAYKLKEQRLTEKQAKRRYINFHSMPFFPYDTKTKEFVFDCNNNLLAQMEKQNTK